MFSKFNDYEALWRALLSWITGYQAAGRQKNAEPSIQSGSQNQNGRARQNDFSAAAWRKSNCWPNTGLIAELEHQYSWCLLPSDGTFFWIYLAINCVQFTHWSQWKKLEDFPWKFQVLYGGIFCLGFIIRLLRFNYKSANIITKLNMNSGNGESNKFKCHPALPSPSRPKQKPRLSLRLGREESEELFISHEALRVTSRVQWFKNGWEQSAKHGNRLYF